MKLSQIICKLFDIYLIFLLLWEFWKEVKFILIKKIIRKRLLYMF